jgi:hypothetical protein
MPSEPFRQRIACSGDLPGCGDPRARRHDGQPPSLPPLRERGPRGPREYRGSAWNRSREHQPRGPSDGVRQERLSAP